MTRIDRLSILWIIVLLTLASLSSWGAGAQSKADAAPVPPLIVSARSVFVSNAGSGCNPFGRVGFSGGPNWAYNQFFAAMKGWGKYQLAAAPADADLVFEISFTCPVAFYGTTPGDDPQLKLVILDVKTRIMLWEITEHIEGAWRKSNLDKNFDEAMRRLVGDLKELAAGVSSPPASANSKS